MVYFDTTEDEVIVQGAATELERVFNQTLRQFDDINATTDCVDTFKKKVVEPFS